MGLSLFVGVQIKIDQAGGGAVVFLYAGFAGQLGEDGFGELFAEFDTPLVEAVDAPDDALDEGFVFVHGNQAAHVEETSQYLRRFYRWHKDNSRIACMIAYPS